MRVLLPAVFCAAAMPLAAWEGLSATEMAAIRGEEPMATALAQAVPLPPVREEIPDKTGFRFAKEQLALKRAVIYSTVRAKGERYRVSRDNYLATAELARQHGAPAIYCRYLELLSAETLNRRQEYAVSRAVQYLLQEAYGIDILQIRLIVEICHLPVKDLLAFMQQMPLHGMFDMVSVLPPPTERIASDLLAMAEVMGKASRLFSGVHDIKTADEAAFELLRLLPLWNTTMNTRAYMHEAKVEYSPVEIVALRFLNAQRAQYFKFRQSLVEKDWYGSTRLQTIDSLLR